MNSPEHEKPVAFSLPINARTLPRKGRTVVYQAPKDVMAQIAADYDLIDVLSFEAKCNLAPWKRDGVRLEGWVKAKIIQPCAVTSEPLDASINEDVEMVFVPDGSKLAKPRVNAEGEWIFDAEGDDLPETFIGDSIDLATVWLEFFAMGIDPFARLPGAEFQSPTPTDEDAAQADHPFAALSKLKTTE